MKEYKWWWDFLSRKFLVLALSTVLLWFDKIDGNVWLYVALAYIGTNVVQKYMEGRSYNYRTVERTVRTDTRKSNIGVAPGEHP